MPKFSLPDNVLQELKCTFCNEYLSQLPVYTYPGQCTVTCGRCPLLQDQNPAHDLAYEKVAKIIAFPCRFKGYGCLDELIPEKLLVHEEHCNFRQYFCPFIPLGTCGWQGPLNEILDHYNENHNALVLHNKVFELDLINKYEENYVLPLYNEIFVIHVRSNKLDDRFWISVRFIGPKQQSNTYSFQVNIGRDDAIVLIKEEVQCDDNMNLDQNKAVSININKMKEDLNSSVVICTVDVITKKNANTAIDDGKKLEDINENVLKELECPICFQFMIPPIHQCVAGHSICDKCKSEVKECPTCRSAIGNTRNFSLEKMMAHFNYPCKYREYGCDFTSVMEELRVHESDCSFGPYECPLKNYDNCSWKNRLNYLLPHIKSEHEECLSDLETVLILVIENEPTEEIFIFSKFEKTFKMHFTYDGTTCYWSMQLIGIKKEAADYMYEIDFNSTETKERLYFRKFCLPYTSTDEAFEKEELIGLPFPCLRPFVVEDFVSFKYRITMKER